MCAGFVLNIILNEPPGILSPEKLIGSFVRKIKISLERFYEETPEARKMAGRVAVLFTLIIFAGIPLALMMIAYKLHPLAGVIVDSLFCWAAFSVRSARDNVSQAFRGIRSGNFLRTKKAVLDLSGKNSAAKERGDLISESVECAADAAAERCTAPLFFCAIAGGFGGMFYRCVSILHRTLSPAQDDFSLPARDLWKVLTFLPSLICAAAIRADAAFLKLDSKNSKFICKRDRKKIKPAGISDCRCSMAGALGISLVDGVTGVSVGEQLKEYSHNDVYWANQLMYGSTFIDLLIFSALRILVYVIIAIF